MWHHWSLKQHLAPRASSSPSQIVYLYTQTLLLLSSSLPHHQCPALMLSHWLHSASWHASPNPESNCHRCSHFSDCSWHFAGYSSHLLHSWNSEYHRCHTLRFFGFSYPACLLTSAWRLWCFLPWAFLACFWLSSSCSSTSYLGSPSWRTVQSSAHHRAS